MRKEFGRSLLTVIAALLLIHINLAFADSTSPVGTDKSPASENAQIPQNLEPESTPLTRYPIDLVFAVNCMNGFWETHQQEEGVQFMRTIARLLLNSGIDPDLHVGVLLPNEDGSGFDVLDLTDDLDSADARLISVQPEMRISKSRRIYLQYPLQYLAAASHHVHHVNMRSMGEWIGPAVQYATDNMKWRSGDNVLKLIYVLDSNSKLIVPGGQSHGGSYITPVGTQYRSAVANAAARGFMVNVFFSSAEDVGAPSNPFAPPTSSSNGRAKFMQDAIKLSGGYIFRVPRDTLPLGYAAKTFPNQDYDERIKFDEDVQISFMKINANSSNEKESESNKEGLRQYREDKQLSSIIYEIQKTHLPYGSQGEFQTSYHVMANINASLNGRSYGGSGFVEEALGQVDISHWDLVAASRLPNFDLSSVPDADLPPVMLGMSLQLRQSLVERMAQRRAELQKNFYQLANLNRWLRFQDELTEAPSDQN